MVVVVATVPGVVRPAHDHRDSLLDNQQAERAANARQPPIELQRDRADDALKTLPRVTGTLSIHTFEE